MNNLYIALMVFSVLLMLRYAIVTAKIYLSQRRIEKTGFFIADALESRCLRSSLGDSQKAAFFSVAAFAIYAFML